MTKRFCDICGREAERDLRLSTWVDHKGEGKGQICVKAHFSFEQRPDGFGGPPDLCRECADELLSKLKA